MNQQYKDFAQSSIKEVNTPLFAKIGMQDKIIRGFVLFLSVLNILAGFNFFYAPIKNVSDNGLIAFALALVILIIIETVSLISFQESIFAINRKKSYGYLLLLLSIIILIFNVYSTAEGNKNFVKQLATKPQKLKTVLSDTLTVIDTDFAIKSTMINRRFDSLNSSINRDYALKIENLENDIKTSVDGNGVVVDWRKNHEATKNKSLLLQNWEKQKMSLADAQNYEYKILKQRTDSIKNLIYIDRNSEINEVTETSKETSTVAYLIGIVLVFLIVTVRLIRVLAQIGCSNFTKKTSGKINVITQLHTIDMEVLDMFKEEKKEEEEKLTKVKFVIQDNRDVIADTEKKVYSSGNGNNGKNANVPEL
jgi:hypothetical protein